MDQIFYIFLLFNILFLIEIKPINILICFIGIVISIAIRLNFFYLINLIEGEYFSYILILVQVSALTILFGFIIMLYPSSNRNKINSFFSLNTYFSIFISIFILFFLFNIYKKNITILSFFNFNSTLSFYYWNYFHNNNIIYSDIYYTYTDTEFLRKLGYFLYTKETNIIKLFLLTIILLLIIIALFFILP